MSAIAQLAALRGRLLWWSFQRLAGRPGQVQEQLLRQIMAANQATDFGQQHRFAQVRSVAEYQAAVPVGDYESFRPWVDRMRQGEGNVLTATRPYMFTLTSGTTGEPKSIPVNGSTRRSTSRLSAMWLHRALADHPRVLDGKAMLVVSPAVEGYTLGGIPFGSASGYIYTNASWAVRRAYALPYAVFSVRDYDAKYYAIMRLALEQDLSLLITPNPSTIMRLVTIADQRRNELVRDIYDGTLAADLDIEPGLRGQLTARLKPNRERAQELERVVKQSGFLDPKEYWPRLSLIACWKGGSVGVTVERLREWFDEDTPFRDIGYLSSEAQVTLPVHDQGSAGVLALDTNFYEFIPEAEMGRDNAKVQTADQLEMGESYYILLTTLTGLYRYDINDVVRVTGFHRQTPVLEFLRKGRDMVSLEGEKLHVGQLVQAMAEAQRVTGVQVAYYRAVGRVVASRYDLALELKQEWVSEDALVALGRAVDAHLATLNIEYDQKRRSGRLAAPCLQVMPKGWHDWRMEAKLVRGLRDVQFKDSLLGLPDAEDDASQPLREVRW